MTKRLMDVLKVAKGFTFASGFGAALLLAVAGNLPFGVALGQEVEPAAQTPKAATKASRPATPRQAKKRHVNPAPEQAGEPAEATPKAAATASGPVAPRQARKKAARKDSATATSVARKALTRPDFTDEDQKQAVVPGFPEVRFWGDSAKDYARAIGDRHGPWLVLSSGGEDGAYGAGFLNGWTAAGNRPDFPVITGVSTGALMAVFAFAGPKYDPVLRDSYTTISAADIFEIGATPESLVDTWPLKKLIEKGVTAELLADIANEHKRGRRLFALTTNLDAGRTVVWDMGAIAVKGDEAALKLFRDILLASSAIPGAFPPVYIEAEANGHRFLEMHADGGVNGPMYIAPESYLFPSADARLPMSQLYLILNGKVVPEFYMPLRTTSTILGRSISLALQMAARMDLVLFYRAARRDGIDFNLAHVEADFDNKARGAFDPDYMKALYDRGFEQGRKGKFLKDLPFHHATAVSEGAVGSVPSAK